jgi:hypothetical protein
MSSYHPRKDKNGGLPNISYIKRKPKPLGTEFKTTTCDANTGVMMWAEIREGKKAMREKEHKKYLGTTCANVVRGMESDTFQPETILLGNSWFASVKDKVKVLINMGDNVVPGY